MKGIKIEIENVEPMQFFRPCDVVEAIAHAIYYTANPKTEMCIPNCAYFQAEKIYDEWFNDTRLKKANKN